MPLILNRDTPQAPEDFEPRPLHIRILEIIYAHDPPGVTDFVTLVALVNHVSIEYRFIQPETIAKALSELIDTRLVIYKDPPNPSSTRHQLAKADRSRPPVTRRSAKRPDPVLLGDPGPPYRFEPATPDPPTPIPDDNTLDTLTTGQLLYLLLKVDPGPDTTRTIFTTSELRSCLDHNPKFNKHTARARARARYATIREEDGSPELDFANDRVLCPTCSKWCYDKTLVTRQR